MVGASAGPLWYIDVRIFDQAFPAMINTSIFKCRINHTMSVWLQMTANGNIDEEATEISTPISRTDGRIADVRCEIHKVQSNLIEVGQQYLKYIGYSFTMGPDTIHSNSSPIASDPQEVDYAYNLPTCIDLRSYLNKNRMFLKRRRVASVPEWPLKEDSRTVVINKRRRSSSNSE